MPRDDREQNFDKALARHLDSTSAAQGQDCLDAETLAAYHERLLDSEEMAQRKAHIASCERCQEILAQLEATDAIPVEADRDLLLDQIVLDLPESEPTGAAPETALQPEPHLESQPEPKSEELASPIAAASQAETLATPEPESTSDLEIEHEPDLVAASAALPSFTRSQSTSPASAAPVASTSAASAATEKSVPPTASTISFRSPREDRPKLVRFVAIAGALAAGLIFWIVYRDQTKPVDVAQNHVPSKLEMPQQPPPPPASENSQNKDANAPTSQLPAATPQSSNAATPAQVQPAQSKSPTDNFDNALADAKKTLDSAKALKQKSRGSAGDLTAANADAAILSPAFTPRAQSPKDAVSSARELANTESPQGAHKLGTPSGALSNAALSAGANTTHPAVNSSSSIPATPPPARTKMNPGVVTDAAADAVAVGAAAPSTSQQQINPAQVESLTKPVANRVVATLSPLSVPAPSGKTIWRIGQAGMIQRSIDSGATWSIQPSGVVIDLIAGSAYSDQVCWLVGRNGTILRTTNGGATWQKLASPSNVDLLAIFSINADSATITDAAGRAFETTTAGSHWTRTRLQQ